MGIAIVLPVRQCELHIMTVIGDIKGFLPSDHDQFPKSIFRFAIFSPRDLQKIFEGGIAEGSTIILPGTGERLVSRSGEIGCFWKSRH